MRRRLNGCAKDIGNKQIQIAVVIKIPAGCAPARRDVGREWGREKTCESAVVIIPIKLISRAVVVVLRHKNVQVAVIVEIAPHLC